MELVLPKIEMPKKSKSQFCACGNAAQAYKRGGWACERCLRLEENYFGTVSEVKAPHLNPLPTGERRFEHHAGDDSEITFKEWTERESARVGRPFKTIQSWFYRGKYPQLKLRRVNERTVFVKI